MKTHTRYALLVIAALAVLIAVFSRRASVQTKNLADTNPVIQIMQAPTNSAPAPESQTNHAEIAPELLHEFNRFIILAKPYGLDEPIKPQEIIAAEPDRVGPKARMALATKTHLAEIDRHNHLRFFISNFDHSNPVAEPEAKRDAMKKWYQATGKWSGEEALAESYRIIERLGISLTVARYEIEAPKLAMKNSQGERVEVTPFYKVKLFNAKDSMVIDAEFRVGESGPGRLTMWWENLPLEAHQRSGNYTKP